MTNHLKDLISYRQLHVLDETYVMNQCKEDSCMVSLSLQKDLEECRRRGNSIVQDYVLPDYTQVKRGFVLDPAKPPAPSEQPMQTIRMNNERVQVPELLFHPSDLGVDQIGVSYAIHHSIESLPEEVRPHLYANILLIGGNACFKNFKERIEMDVRSLANHLFDVNVYLPENPVTEAWKGAQLIINNGKFDAMSVPKKDYDENGIQFCIDRFS